MYDILELKITSDEPRTPQISVAQNNNLKNIKHIEKSPENLTHNQNYKEFSVESIVGR